MSDTETFKLADGVTFESVTEGAVVLVFDNGQLYSCNDHEPAATAARLGLSEILRMRKVAAISE